MLRGAQRARSEIVGDVRYTANAEGRSGELGIVAATTGTTPASHSSDEVTESRRARARLRTMQGVGPRDNRGQAPTS